jgi:hypothetical protein
MLASIDGHSDMDQANSDRAKGTEPTERRMRLYCNTCKNETNHILRGEHRRSYSEDDTNYWEETFYRLWTCAGCDTGLMESAWTCQGMQGPDGEEFIISYDPERASADLHPKVFRQIPEPLSLIYKEAVRAFNLKLPISCAGALRALIEGICEDKNIGGRTLEERINGLEGILPGNIVTNLHGFRFMGNDALHRLTTPARASLQLAIEVSEDLLNFLYELDYKAGDVPPAVEIQRRLG